MNDLSPHMRRVTWIDKRDGKVRLACGHEHQGQDWRPHLGELVFCAGCANGAPPNAATELQRLYDQRQMDLIAEARFEEARNQERTRGRDDRGEFFMVGGRRIYSAEDLRAAMAHLRERRTGEDRRTLPSDTGLVSDRTFVVRTVDHPNLPRNRNRPDRRVFAFWFPTEDGRTLRIEIGSECRAHFERGFLEHLVAQKCGSADPQEDR